MAFELRSIETTREFDFGDAPDPTYPTKMSTNGAHHLIMPGIYLGSLLDGETDGFSDPDAMYDDNNGSNDEDGVLFASALSPGKTVEVSVAASAPGFLNGWVDFNFNGTWGDAGEQIFVDVVLEPGVNVLTVDVPEQAVIATTFARFRFDPVGGVSFKGLAIGGEVEDYLLTIESAVFGDSRNQGIPTEFKIFQNYPNPFNPETRIEYQLPHMSEVVVTIYDIYGREVRTLVNGEMAQGYHSVVWDGRNSSGVRVASGIYFYHIEVKARAGKTHLFRDVKKMILMK